MKGIAMNLSERMGLFAQFLVNVQRVDFGQINDLNDAKDALNEFKAITNRFENRLNAEVLKQKGF